MGYGCWLDAAMGLILATAPIVTWLRQGPMVLYVDVVVGLSLLALAIVSYLRSGDRGVRGERPSHA